VAKGRAYMRPDENAALYRVKIAHPRRPGEVRIIGPYATIGPARGQASEFKRSGYTVEVQVARPVWEPVDGPPLIVLADHPPHGTGRTASLYAEAAAEAQAD